MAHASDFLFGKRWKELTYDAYFGYGRADASHFMWNNHGYRHVPSNPDITQDHQKIITLKYIQTGRRSVVLVVQLVHITFRMFKFICLLFQGNSNC